MNRCHKKQSDPPIMPLYDRDQLGRPTEHGPNTWRVGEGEEIRNRRRRGLGGIGPVWMEL